MKTYSFENLLAWKESKSLVNEVYRITSEFPKEELYGLTSQMRRAAISVTCNLSEGSGRKSKADQKNFYRMAYSSLLEVLNVAIISKDLRLIGIKELADLREQIDKAAFLINKLYDSINEV